MAKSPEIMRITNEGMAKGLIDAGKRLIEMGMALRDVGIPVVVSYDIEARTGRPIRSTRTGRRQAHE